MTANRSTVFERLLAANLERHADALERDAARARAAAVALNGARTLPAPIPAVERLRDPAYRRTSR